MPLIWIYLEVVMRKLAGYPVALFGGCVMNLGILFKKNLADRSLPPAGGLVQIIGWQLYRLLFKGLSPIMIRGGGFLFVSGFKIKTIAGEKLLKLRRDPPVLYLRSFKLDRNRDPEFTARTQEETLSTVLKRVGPCVTVKDPTKKEVFLGFSRLKMGDEWQVQVGELVKQSKLVVLCAGGTKGLISELKTVANLVTPRSKLLLIITDAVTDEWWELANQLLGVARQAVEPQLESLVRLGFRYSYRAVVYFDESGKPHESSLHEGVRRPRALLEDALDPLFLQLGIRQRPKFIRWLSEPTPWVTLLRVLFAVLFVSFLLFLLAEIVLHGLGIAGN
jgi:hypothetical protein